ncbi:MAG: transposase [Anaerolineales bacterium]|nr:transposase [Anaerolineales bacterium]
MIKQGLNVLKFGYHERKPTRLPNWDYSTPGYYFVTICVREMACQLGDVVDEHVILSLEGKIAHQTWLELPNHYPGTGIEPFIIMPNHLHAIIEIGSTGGFSDCVAVENPPEKVKEYSLTEIIRAFKTWSARRINLMNDTTGAPFWHRSFYDRIIRNEGELHAIEKYIQSNPQRWVTP